MSAEELLFIKTVWLHAHGCWVAGVYIGFGFYYKVYKCSLHNYIHTFPCKALHSCFYIFLAQVLCATISIQFWCKAACTTISIHFSREAVCATISIHPLREAFFKSCDISYINQTILFSLFVYKLKRCKLFRIIYTNLPKVRHLFKGSLQTYIYNCIYMYIHILNLR